MEYLINQVHNKDCLEVLRLIPDESINLVATDCPYRIISGGVRTEYKDDERSGVLGKRDYSKTDPKGVLNRRFIGCEIDPVYYQICVDRLSGEYDKGSLI